MIVGRVWAIVMKNLKIVGFDVLSVHLPNDNSKKN